jgi:hypothetical protein
MKVVTNLWNIGYLVPVTQRHILEDFNLQQHRYENHTSPTFSFSDTVPHDPSVSCCSYKCQCHSVRLRSIWRNFVIFRTNCMAVSIAHCCYVSKGARGGAVGWGTALQAGRSRVRFPIEPLKFIDNPSGRTMGPGLTQPLTEMSTRNISWGVKAAGA